MLDRVMKGGRLSRRSAVLTLAMAAAALSTGCYQNNDPDTAAEPVPVTWLRVQNQAFLDMTIYVYRNSQRIRLGQATGNAETKFRIPANLLFGATPLQFQADPIGGRRAPLSQEITVAPGDEVFLTIPPN